MEWMTQNAAHAVVVAQQRPRHPTYHMDPVHEKSNTHPLAFALVTNVIRSHMAGCARHGGSMPYHIIVFYIQW